MSDKRSVHTDALETLGTIFEGGERDAIHLAVEPIVAGTYLNVGQHIGIGNDGLAYPQGRAGGVKLVGIVDPFLKTGVKKGERFWLVVYPRQITSLRHVWSHPDFREPGEPSPEEVRKKKEYSENWLRDFVDTADCPSYEEVVRAYMAGSVWDDYLHFNGQDAHGEIPYEFWDHMEVITGHRITERPKYFSCSC